MNNLTPQKAQELKDWYWKYGVMRRDAYALTRGGWYDRLQRTLRELLTVNSCSRKPTMALWGPSQSGKSTMLQCFIDHAVSEDGKGGALGWDPEVPTRFCGDNKDHTIAVLNPYNQGADASGCVTRYQLRKEVPHPRYPVELHFATTSEILLYLAIGYLSETVATVNDETAGGEATEQRVQLDEQKLTELIQECTGAHGSRGSRGAHTVRTAPAQATPGDVIDRGGGVSLLTDICDVIETLIDMEENRYFNLKKGWPSLRAAILNNDTLLASRDVIYKFASHVFWDGWKNLSDMFVRLEAKRAELARMFEGKRIHCTLEMTALMLNISAAGNYGISDNVRHLVNSCGVRHLGTDAVAICENGEEKLFAGAADAAIEFALVQSLVSLIVVPLKDDVMATGNKEAYELLKYADLVDFPGVANEEASAKRLEDEQLSFTYRTENGRRPLYGFTQVMKRGKTASIVVSYARDLNIDGFSLLVRMPAGSQYPAKPVQLMNGIRSWVKAMTGQPCNALPRDKGPPINLVLTFSATLLNLVNGGGMNDTGLNGVFSKLRTLSDLSNASCVNTFCVNYPQFPDGKFHDDTVEGKTAAINRILEDRYFREQFQGTEDALKAMAGLSPDDAYNGRLYLFSHIRKQLEGSKRPQMLEERGKRLLESLNACLHEAMPGNSGDDERKKDIRAVIKAVSNEDLRNSTDDIGLEVRTFMDVAVATVQPPPLSSSNKEAMRKYLEGMFAQWAENAKNAPMQKYMGFTSVEHRNRFISYICTQPHLSPRNMLEVMLPWLATIIRATNGHPQAREELRRLVATYMCNMLFYTERIKNSEEVCIRELSQNLGSESKAFSTAEASAYYRTIIVPFLELSERMLKDDGTNRPAQPGDDELIELSEDSENA